MFAGVIPERLIFRTRKVTLKPAGFQPTKYIARTRDKLASRSTVGSRVVARPNVLRRTYVHVTWTTANC